MNPFNYHVSLRVHHPEMDPEHICNQLRLKAEFKWRAGDDRKTPKGQALKGVYETSYCSFELKHPKNVKLADFLKRYSRKLCKHREFLKSIRSTGGTLEYFVGWFSDQDSGDTFDLELLNQMSELGIEFSLAVYGKREDRLLPAKKGKLDKA